METKDHSSNDLPSWYPRWAKDFGELYFSGTTSMFVLHGNTHDFVRGGNEDKFLPLSEFLAEQLFGKWDLVLYYDLSTGLRVLAGSDAGRQQKMTELAGGLTDAKTIGKDPSVVLNVLNKFIELNIMAEDHRRLSVAVILNHASFLVRHGDRTLKNSVHLATLLNWASSPYVKKINAAFVLIDSGLSDISQRLVNNPHTASLEVPLPDEEARQGYLKVLVKDRPPIDTFSDYTVDQLATLTAGISLTDLRVLVNSTVEGGRRLNADRFRKLKKMLLERQAGGLLEFIEPKWGLDMVIGHEAAKKQLKDDAALLARGALKSVPMGYLLCGPVGTGKSFLAECAAGELGVPCIKLKNFRGGLVGETESNLERVLGVLRSMGPVVVVVDEADAMLGSRKSSGDSGTSSRVFGMIAQQMGDTRYRGKILWMLLTARPDYLPIDLKRQGRAEVHMPLFYPTKQEELHQMFLVLARKLDATLHEDAVPEVSDEKLGQLSGADIEGLLGRAWRTSLLEEHDYITGKALQEALDGFIPMAQSLERQLQTLAAIIECTDEQFLTEDIKKTIEELGGRTKVQERLNQLKAVVDG